MVRTLFEEPTAAHGYTQFLIAEKWLATDQLSTMQRKRWIDRQATAAYILYRHDDPRAARCLSRAFTRTRRPRLAVQGLTNFAGLSRSQLKRVASLFGLKEAS